MSALTPAKTIRIQPWMNAPETKTVMAAMNEGAGDEPLTLFVGGCVRNALLTEPVEDIDLATKLTPDEVTERLKAAGIKVIPTGIDHGTVTAVQNGRAFEITTLRKDVETDGRHAVVAFAQSWREDAERRDFTMNTLLADDQGHVYDPIGRGLADLEARKVIFVGQAALRIQEDYLRILRFFRFHALYGAGKPDAAALKACKAQAGHISSLSAERITQEFFKIISVDKPEDVLGIMLDNNVLTEILWSKDQLEFLGHFCSFQKRYGLISLSSRLYVLCALDKGNLPRKSLLIPKVFLRDMDAMGEVLSMPDMDNERAVRAAIYKGGRTASAQALMIELTQDRVMNGYAPKALEIIQNWDVPSFPIDGQMLIEAGYKTGPELGIALSELEERWIASDFKQSREDLLAALPQS